ncbi:restriction endonuclease subunit S [Frankia sp. CcWB3]
MVEQRRIVAVLEGSLERIRQGVGGLERTLLQIDHLRSSLLSAVCFGRVGRWADAPRVTFLHDRVSVDGDVPGIPLEWHWCRLGEIADVVGGVTKDGKKKSDPDLPEVPYLRVANVQRGYLDLAKISTIRVPAAKARALTLQPGDVLLNEGGDRDKLGRGWVWDGQIDGCIHQNHVFRVRLYDGILHPKLLAWHANEFGQGWCEKNGRQSVNLASISLSQIKRLPVPIPPVEAQADLVSAAEEWLSVLDTGERLVRGGLAKATVLRKALLAEAFTGRLVAQDPADESASVLLERIRAERAGAVKAPRRRPRKLPAQEGQSAAAVGTASRPMGEWASVEAVVSAPMLPLDDVAIDNDKDVLG